MESHGGNSLSSSEEHEPSHLLKKSTNSSAHGDSVCNLSTSNDNKDVEVKGNGMECSDMDEASTNIETLINAFSLIDNKSDVPKIPQSVETFTKMMDLHIEKYNHQDSPITFGQDLERDNVLIKGVTRLSKLNDLLDKFSVEEYVSLIKPVVQRGMACMEKELHILLQSQEGYEETKISEEDEIKYPRVSQDIIESVKKIVGAMISCGYQKDCSQLFTSLRKDALNEAMKHQDSDKISNEDIQKMQWESLETHIINWVKLAKHVAKVLLPEENNLCVSVFFPEHPSVGETVITNLAKPVVTSLLNLAEAVSMTKRYAERLFKVLEMYEAITDLMLALDSSKCSKKCINEIRSEISVIRRRKREAVIEILSDIENSIKNDASKNPVPGGGVHPLVRYITNYLGFVCDFRDTLEHVFLLHQNNHEDEIDNPDAFNNKNKSEVGEPKKYATFAPEVIKIMNHLDDNLEAKSRLYKDPSLRYIFLMNNGRYILQKMKESTEIREVIGDEFRRKRSSELRGYHKSYQRETWSRVLQCLNQEGLQVNSKVQKPLVKERLKSFNQMFDEIYKTQSSWVVSDKQLQSELRVSISSVMIPAYRSFVARFGQCFGSGRQAQKYIKYQPEDIESSIEALFDGNGQTLSMARKRLSFPH